MMFRFLELSLHGWDLWSNLRLRLDRDVVLLTGPNGSGKTTILDAIRQLLNAPKLSSKRRLQHYLRRPDAPALIRAVVSNRAPGNGTPTFRRENVLTPEATLACALLPSSSGSPEKRFAILPGNASIDEIQSVLDDPRRYHTPDRYSRALEAAGLTRNLINVLAIDQGKMNQHFDLKPRELFSRVLEMLGDRVVLDRYKDARGRFEDSQRQALSQAEALSKLNIQLSQVQRRVQERERWEEASEKVGRLGALLPASELQAIWRMREESAPKLQEFRTKIHNREVEEIRQVRFIEALNRTCIKEDEDLAKAEGNEKRASQALIDASAQSKVLAARALELEEAQRAAKQMPEMEIKVLEGNAKLARNAAVALALTQDGVKERILMATENIASLRKGLPPYPDAVKRTIQAMDSQGLHPTLLATLLEPMDEDHSEAVESALGPIRYALLTTPEHASWIISIARENDFPGPVYSGSQSTVDLNTPWLKISPGAPAWISTWIQGVVVRPDGTWEDSRGVWVVRPSERILGKRGIEAALAKAELDLAQLQRDLATLETQCHDAEDQSRNADDALVTEKKRRELLAKAAGLSRARNQVEEAKRREKNAVTANEEARLVVREAMKSSQTSKANLKTATQGLDDLRKQLGGEREALVKAQAEAADLERRSRELEPRVAAELQEKARRGEIDSPSTIKSDLDRAEGQLKGLGVPPAPEVREEYRHLKANIEEAESHVQERQREAEKAQRELAECRRRYLDVVDRALQDYRRRAIDLGSRADVVVEMDLPKLGDDDRSIDEAEIQASFGFDGKDTLPLGHSAFSGGQQVIAGIILLMAVAETEGQGFFILDEPFAHLSLDRVDDVGRFLRNAKSQFILTAPTTLDRNQLDPASLVVVLSKKRPDEKHAPHPVVAIS
jgi:DNA repair exonuclease SbcCD ATPase subunit